MPVAEQNSVNSYTGNGVTTTFPYTFKVFAAADLKVTVDGALQTLNVHYSVTGAGDAGGGNVVFVNPPDNVSHNPLVIVYRDLSYKRDTDYVESGDMLASTFDNDLDRVVMLIQQLNDDRKRAIKLPKGETADQVLPSPATRANRAIGFDASGNLVMMIPTAEGLSSFLGQPNTFTEPQTIDDGLTVNGQIAVNPLSVLPPLVLGANAQGQKSVGLYADMADMRRNFIIDGCCRVAQANAPNISASYQYGQVDMFAAKADGTPTAGTIAQTASSVAGRTGYALRIAGLSVGAGGAVYVRYRMESLDARHVKNQAAVFHCKVHHDSASTVSYTVTINKANATDNFTAITQIATSATPLNIAGGVEASLSLSVANMGDCTNGVEIIVKADCGAVTTKTFDFAEMQFEHGSTPTSFQRTPFLDELRAVERYLEKTYDLATPPGTLTSIAAMRFRAVAADNNTSLTIRYRARKRAAPTVTIYNPVTGAAGSMRDLTVSANVTPVVTNSGQSNFIVAVQETPAGANTVEFHFVADARL